MPILGQYNMRSQNISIDVPSHLFEKDHAVVFHEQAHYYLTNYTNEGAVLSILHEVCKPPLNLVVDKSSVGIALKLLGNDMYDAQEGLAHLIQAITIFDDNGGFDAVKEWEDRLPIEPKTAFSATRYCVKLTREQQDKFTNLVSDISLNTSIHQEVIKDPSFLLDDRVKNYLQDENTSSKKRFDKICREIERDPTLLDMKTEDVCKKIGIPFTINMSNAEKASLINAIYSFTDKPTSATEADIKTLKDVSDIYMPSYEGMIMVNVNIPNLAKTKLSKDEVSQELKHARTIFVYNNSDSPQAQNHFGFYSFSKGNLVINSALELGSESTNLVNNFPVTRVIDTASFDFTQAKIKPEREFVQADILWHKSYQDLVPLLDMIKSRNVSVQACSFAFTDEHEMRFYLIRLKDSDILHITPGRSFIENRLKESGIQIETTDFFEITKGKEAHLNNFLHDVLGVPYLIDMIEMAKDAEKYLETAKQVRDHGMGRNEQCICGSTKKWKRCHGC